MANADEKPRCPQCGQTLIFPEKKQVTTLRLNSKQKRCPECLQAQRLINYAQRQSVRA